MNDNGEIVCDFKSLDEEQRRWAIIQASKTSDASSLPILLSLLNTDTYENRRHIVRALGKIGGEICQNRLLKLLYTESGLILGDIAKSLGQIRCVAALDSLANLLNHEDVWVQQNAMWAINQLRDT